MSSGQLNRPRHQDRTARLCLATFRPRQRPRLFAVSPVNRQIVLRSTATRGSRGFQTPKQLAAANRQALSLRPTGLLRPTLTQRLRRQVALHPDRLSMPLRYTGSLPRARRGDRSRAHLRNSHLRPRSPLRLLAQLLPMPKRGARHFRPRRKAASPVRRLTGTISQLNWTVRRRSLRPSSHRGRGQHHLYGAPGQGVQRRAGSMVPAQERMALN